MTAIIFTCSTCNARIANAADVRAEIAAKDKEIARLREALARIGALHVMAEGNVPGGVVSSREIDAIAYAALATGSRERSEDE